MSRSTIYGLTGTTRSSSLANGAGESLLVPSDAITALSPTVDNGYEASGYCGAYSANLDPSRVPATSDLPANKAGEAAAVDAVVAVAHDGAVDVPGDNQDKRVVGCFECPFDRRGVE